ncbi:MAG: tRNA (N(6)-L-threonylcarbamoyladenosine(37)-C(2))-methylthiotransferase, partial [Nanoarchaeota archaeon]
MQNYLNSNTLEIYFETYGCTANQNSTEIMKGLVSQSGLNLTNNTELADIIVINSCIVKSPTEEKIRRRLEDLQKKFPNKKFILAGCMPRLLKDKFQKPNLYLLDTTHSRDIGNLIKDIYENNYEQEKYLKQRKETKVLTPKISQNKIIATTQISEGCLGNCTYCITRLAKGKLNSFSQDDIINSIKRDIQAGSKEIWITSQDNASYGLEQSIKENYQLPELLKKILEIPGNFKIRLGMSNPNHVLKILEQLIEIYKNPKMFKFIHLPIQSGSDKVLKDMNRGYTKKDILKIINKFKKEIPDILISTDIIVGYPTETEQDFQETLDLISEIKPEILNKSNFYSRPGTQASKLKLLNPEIVKKRAKKLDKLHLEICKNIQKEFIEKNKDNSIKVLVDKKGWQGTYLARADNYKLVVVHSQDKTKNLLGKFVNV